MSCFAGRSSGTARRAGLAAAVLCVFAQCRGPGSAKDSEALSTYTVAVTYLPDRLDPRRNRINVFHDIILQLYYPLLSRAEDGRLSSAFLDMAATRATSRNFDQYQLCLRDGVRFVDGSAITADDLQSSLSSFYETRPHLPRRRRMEATQSCVVVLLDAPDPHYLDRLVTVAATVLKGGGGEAWRAPVGLGPFEVAEWGPARLSLRRREAAQRGFDRIDFVLVADLEDALYRRLMDVNLLYWESDRAQRLEAWPKLDHQVMRSYALIVATTDATVRDDFARCFDRDAFVHEALAMPLIRTAGYLPTGLPGSRGPFARPPPCRDAFLARPEIAFVNPLPQRSAALKAFFAQANEHLPVRVRVEDTTWNGLLADIRRHRTMLYVMGMDTANSQFEPLDGASVFFEAFYSEARCLKERLHEVGDFVEAALRDPAPAHKAVNYEKAHRALLDSHYVVPLGQEPPVFYHAPGVAHVAFDDPMSAYPRVDSMVRRRW